LRSSSGVASGFDCAVWSTAREVAEVIGVTGVTPQSGVDHLAPVGRVRLEAGELPVTACFEDDTDKPQRINENAVLTGHDEFYQAYSTIRPSSGKVSSSSSTISPVRMLNSGCRPAGPP
jgi:hypothetical protein